ncbi:MAG: hypothetical protein H0X03_01065 [Nitrosopumilus sp.]|nr:hypothetical protein [Nitrosopumilus sp.]
MITSGSLDFESIVINSANAQNGRNTTLEQMGSPSNNAELNELTPISEESSTLLVTKSIRCESDLGIPSNEAVCQFVSSNVESNQFTITVTGNNSNPSNFQGSINGTEVTLNPGNYTVSETQFDPMNLENSLGETAIGTVSTSAEGDCTAQFTTFDAFQNVTGTIDSGESQKCDIINTIEITAGDAPGGP